MTRTLSALAAAPLAAAVFAAAAFVAPAAEACISCEYVPPVVNTPVHSFSGHYSAPRRTYTATRKRARKIERETVEVKRKPRKVETAKSAEPVSVKPAKVEANVSNENSTISTASIDKSDTEVKTDSKATGPKEASNNVGCKKFFPSVGMTLSVPCE